MQGIFSLDWASQSPMDPKKNWIQWIFGSERGEYKLQLQSTSKGSNGTHQICECIVCTVIKQNLLSYLQSIVCKS